MMEWGLCFASGTNGVKASIYVAHVALDFLQSIKVYPSLSSIFSECSGRHPETLLLIHNSKISFMP